MSLRNCTRSISLTKIIAATKIQIINEAVGLRFDCTPHDLVSGACVAQTGGQLYVKTTMAVAAN